MSKNYKNLRTWVEIDERAAKKNCETFRKIIGSRTKLWAVVKSNAYGHGLVQFSQLVNGEVDGFCVDSLVEGITLRKAGIKKPILVLGPTLPALLGEAAKNKITISAPDFDTLKALASFVAKKAINRKHAGQRMPEFHVKIDTGLHRQGFYLKDLPKVAKLMRNWKLEIGNSPLRGVYTHFAAAKDINYPTYTEKQFAEFQKAIKLFKQAGSPDLVAHCAATGGVLMNQKYHLDAVRIGIGMYGCWPSRELEVQFQRKIVLRPVLSWRTVVADVKKLKAGDYVGYDLSEKVSRPTKMAVLPIGYWHGFPRSLSSTAEVLVRGKRAKVLGRVSMDLLSIDVTGISCKVGDLVTMIGKDGKEESLAQDVAQRSGTTHYEFLTRLNPLMERVLI